MSEPQTTTGVEPPRRWTRAAVWVSSALAAIALAWLDYQLVPADVGQAQPISFSHRFHVSTKDLSCLWCHPGAVDSAHAGVPPLETCMLCHKRIIPSHPEIVKLRGHYDARRTVEWERVNDLPDFVYFDHSIHLHRGIDCGRCHGDVAHMDRIRLEQSFKMGFCVQCHRDYGVTHDCFACHR